MKRILALSLFALLAGTVYAADAPATAPGKLPPGEPQAKDRLNTTPRHPEFIDIDMGQGKKPMRAFVVYPERPDKAPTVLVIMEIFGVSDWLRATCDQLAADGFIAVAPDFLTGKGPNGGATESFASRDDVTRAVRTVTPEEVVAGLNAARDWAIKQPSANGKVATMGFCWGGGQSFLYAAAQPKLDAAVVFYGSFPAEDALKKVNGSIEGIKAPIEGFFGGNDNRVTGAVPATKEKLDKAGKSFVSHVYEGAGHGFVRTQGPDRQKDLDAVKAAWPTALAFLREKLK